MDETKKLPEPFTIEVDKAAFFETGRVFKRVFRARAANVVLTLRKNWLRIEFYGGGCELKCESPHNLDLEIKKGLFSAIISAYSKEKSFTGKIPLTFRPELGEFATPLAGAKAKYLFRA